MLFDLTIFLDGMILVEELIIFIFPISIFTFIHFILHSRNPVYSILSFVIVVAHVSFLLVLLDVEFLAYVLAIVYIGAIVVLFLFVIMMFSIRKFDAEKHILQRALEYIICGSVVASSEEICSVFPSLIYYDLGEIVNHQTFVQLSANLLFNEYYFLTILAGLIMLVGIVAAIALTLHLGPVVNLNSPSMVRIRNSSTDILNFKK